jgi:hypothetical protein
MEMRMASKITEGLKDTVAFAKGDRSKGRSTMFHVSDRRVGSEIESIGGELLAGSGFESEQSTA